MGRLVRWIRRLIKELRRRRVIRVAAVYAGTGFVILELADILQPALQLPSWTVRFIAVLLALGFPLAVGLAWTFDVTKEGLVRTGAEGEDLAGIGPGGKPFTSNWILIGLLAVAIGLLLYPRLFSSEEKVGGQASVPDTAQVEKRSIAVLPFEPLSAGKKSKTFAQGIHDDLLTRLANISALTVISRTAVQQYRNTDLTTGEIADSLGVRWVMEGGVQVLQDQIQVNAQLIDPRTETHAWADDYRRDLTAEDLFAIQGEITREIADALKAKLTTGEQNRITGAPTQNLDAYRAYVKGRTHLNPRSSEGMRQAVGYFQQALREDSTFALAWSGLADAIGLSLDSGLDSLGASVPSHEEAARRALRFGPDLAEAHASMGLFHITQQNGPAALRHLRRSVSLKPSYAQAQHWLGLVQLYLDRLKKAKEHILRAVDLDPQHWAARITLGEIHLAEGQAERAYSQMREAVRRTRRDSIPKAWGFNVLYHLDRYEKARQVARDVLSEADSLSRQYVAAIGFLAQVDAATGDTSRAKGRLDRFERYKKALGRPLHFETGMINAALGNEDAAFAAFRKARIRGLALTIFRYWYPDLLGPLREDPRYEELIREVNRAWGLNPDGSIPNENAPSSPTGPESDV